MRIFSFLFSLYLLGLAVLPCGDRHECTIMQDFPSLSATTQHEDHEHEHEYCSPFCLCSCCGLSMNKENVEMHFQNPVSHIPSGIPQYKEKMPMDIYLSIWQPPKIS